MKRIIACFAIIASALALGGCQEQAKVFSLDHSLASEVSGKYSTGNYGGFSYNAIQFEYYRALGGQNDILATLIPFSHPYGDALGGSIYNTTSIELIKKMTIEYKTSIANGEDKPTLYYGVNGYTYSLDLDYSQSYKTVTFGDMKEARYFKIESGNARVDIKSIQFECEEIEGRKAFARKSSGDGQYRAHPAAYDGDLISGVSKADAPIEVSINNGQYSIISSRTYTYYTYEYVVEHPEIAAEASVITPVDIANYYALFKQIPANFVSYGMKDDEMAQRLFGRGLRIVSSYDRTDGYLRHLPYERGESTGKPFYYEFDLALNDDYSPDDRSVGRLVILVTGFKGEDYRKGADVVSLLTDDHYSTFQEFNNLGSFMTRFNAEKNITPYVWDEAQLVTA